MSSSDTEGLFPPEGDAVRKAVSRVTSMSYTQHSMEEEGGAKGRATGDLRFGQTHPMLTGRLLGGNGRQETPGALHGTDFHHHGRACEAPCPVPCLLMAMGRLWGRRQGRLGSTAAG